MQPSDNVRQGNRGERAWRAAWLRVVSKGCRGEALTKLFRDMAPAGVTIA